MAEERHLGTVRAPEAAGDEEATKAELQRRMEEAREAITQTVTEIKDTVANQYQSVKESVTDALDWREQYRRRPVAFSVGALAAGFIVGYSVAGVVKGDGHDYYDYEEAEAEGTPQSILTGASRSYAAQPITGASSSASARSAAPEEAVSSPRIQYQPTSGIGYTATYEKEEEEEKGPSLLDRFKETAAFDRLQSEVSNLGDRVIEELSKTAQTVVLPALFAKIKDYIGLDLSNKDEGRQGAGTGGTQYPTAGRGTSATGAAAANRSAQASAGASGGMQASSNLPGGSASGSQQGAGQVGGASYGAGENRG